MPSYFSPGSSVVGYEVILPVGDRLLDVGEGAGEQPEPEGISVFFEDGSIYSWYASGVGRATLDMMISLAQSHSGLGSFIYRNVRFEYSHKIV